MREHKCMYCAEQIDSTCENFFCHECVRLRPEPLPTNPSIRIQNRLYLHDGIPVYWRGKILVCIHGVRRTTCKHKTCCKLETHCIHELPLSSPCEKCARAWYQKCARARAWYESPHVKRPHMNVVRIQNYLFKLSEIGTNIFQIIG